MFLPKSELVVKGFKPLLKIVMKTSEMNVRVCVYNLLNGRCIEIF